MQNKSFKKLLVLLSIAWCSISWSQKDSSVIGFRQGEFKGFPIAYYAPETSLAFGLLGVYTFQFKNDSLNKRVSNLTLGTAYTLRNQILFYLPFTLFSHNDKNRYIGEVGFYKYTYFYFGIGNDQGGFKEKMEQYEVTFPRLRMTYLRKLCKNLYAGAKLSSDYYYNISFPDSSSIRDLKTNGYDAGANTGIGPALFYDSRDQIYYPRKGSYLDASFTKEIATVSNYDFLRLNVEFSHFQTLRPKSVLGWNASYQLGSGDIPFYHLPLLGGGKKLRGQFEGEFRDKNVWQTQLEFRQELFKNWGAVAFLGVGWAAPTVGAWRLDQVKEGYGVGLRYKLNKNEHINIRVDVGVSQNKILPYFTIGEAF